MLHTLSDTFLLPRLSCSFHRPRTEQEGAGPGCNLVEPGLVQVTRTFPRRLGCYTSPGNCSRNRWWGCTWGNLAHPGLWGPSWKDHWVTGVGVCMRVALPLSDGSQGHPAGQLRACSQPGLLVPLLASPSQAQVIPGLGVGG